MMPNFIDMTGMIIGKWEVVERSNNAPDGTAMWLCRCLCGKEKLISGSVLRRRKTLSCIKCRTRTKGIGIKHGDAGIRLYRIWSNIKRRCRNLKDEDYPAYGGRGIDICDEWSGDYRVFRDWALDNGYKDNLTIDRINVNGNYEPNNCRWATMKEQNNNRRDNRIITYNNISKTVSEWADIMGIKLATLYNRVFNLNWDVERALTEKPTIGGPFKSFLTVNGATLSATEWSKITGVNCGTILSRINRGWTEEKFLKDERFRKVV